MEVLATAALGVALVVLGFGALVLRRLLIWKLLGLNVASGGAILFLVSLSYRPGGKPPLIGFPAGIPSADPLPQALVLTAIVIHFATLALSLAYAVSLAEQLHTQEAERIEEATEEEMER
jgi:multicomponent Na+:H+ antiporter subunit C